MNMSNKKITEVSASKKVTVDLKNDLNVATKEKGVENAYWKAIKNTFDTEISDDYETDGFIRIDYADNSLFLLLEFKFKRALTKRSNAIGVIIQTLFYMHSIRNNMTELPNLILIGDQDNAFVLKAKTLYKYLDRDDINWDIAPSDANNEYKATLVIELFNDPDIKYYLHNIDSTFTFNDLVEDIKVLISDGNEKIKLNPNTIGIAFDRFIASVVEKSSEYTPEELVSFFLTVILDRDQVFINSSRNELDINQKKIRINKSSYEVFIEHFESEYRPTEKRIFTEISDRLIQDAARRQSGEFYTPSAFVEFAYERMDQKIGQGWENDFLVWDPAWGTGNLTRDRAFQELYASTLYESDLKIGEQYNKTSDKFQFDFLNDDIDFGSEDSIMYQQNHKIPEKLAKTFIETPEQNIIFFLNPPYATAGNANSNLKKIKTDISKTLISEEMKNKKYEVQEQLYAQFLYRILKMKRSLNLNNLYIALFSPSLFITGPKYKKFRSEFFKDFEYVDGNIFEASNFADVADGWAIDFSIWKAIKPKKTLWESNSSGEATPNDNFKHNVLSLDSQGNVEIIDHKTLWNTDNNKSLQQFLIDNTGVPSSKYRKVLQFSSRYKYKKELVSVPVNSIGILVNDTNNIEASVKGVYIMSSPITRHIKTSLITEDTVLKQMMVLTARKVITPTWFNQKDEFFAPDVNDPKYSDFERKSFIYSIFSPANQVISYRVNEDSIKAINYNHWAFVNSKRIRDLADENHNDDLYNDALQYSNEPFAYKYIKSHKDALTEIEKELLDNAVQIVEKTIKFRKIMDEERPKLFLNTWDASWNQITQIANEYLPDELNEFRKIFSRFNDELVDDVYNLRILKDQL